MRYGYSDYGMGGKGMNNWGQSAYGAGGYAAADWERDEEVFLRMIGDQSNSSGAARSQSGIKGGGQGAAHSGAIDRSGSHSGAIDRGAGGGSSVSSGDNLYEIGGSIPGSGSYPSVGRTDSSGPKPAYQSRNAAPGYAAEERSAAPGYSGEGKGGQKGPIHPPAGDAYYDPLEAARAAHYAAKNKV